MADCPEKVNTGGTISGTCHLCEKPGHKAENCWEKEENTDKRPKGWVSSKKKNESNGSKEVAAIEIVL